MVHKHTVCTADEICTSAKIGGATETVADADTGTSAGVQLSCWIYEHNRWRRTDDSDFGGTDAAAVSDADTTAVL
jgi:hypothetical protein